MKSENDILAEYVRERYPSIETSFDFAAYRLSAKIWEAVNHMTDAVTGFVQSYLRKEQKDDEREDSREDTTAETAEAEEPEEV